MLCGLCYIQVLLVFVACVQSEKFTRDERRPPFVKAETTTKGHYIDDVYTIPVEESDIEAPFLIIPDVSTWGNKKLGTIQDILARGRIFDYWDGKRMGKRSMGVQYWVPELESDKKLEAKASQFSHFVKRDEINDRMMSQLMEKQSDETKKRRTSFANWAGKRSPQFNTWGGKRSPSFNTWAGKRSAFKNWGGKRAIFAEDPVLPESQLEGHV